MRLALPTTLVTTVAAAVLALAGPLGGSSAQAAGSTAHTHRVVVRPVDAHGHPVAGWSVTGEHDVTVTCDAASPGAVDPNIWICSPAAVYAVACWRSHHHTVLCLRDARTHALVRIRWTGTLSAVSPPRHPVPQDLVIAHRQPCQLRIGGAWSVLPTHPDWSGYYSCSHGDVYGPTPGDGIDESHQPWTVHLWKSGTAHRVVVRQVRTAYFVGTHR